MTKETAFAESLIKEAHKNVVAEFFIEHENTRHVIYIHDIIVKPTGELDISYSTPSENVDKNWLAEEVQKAVIAITNQVSIKPTFTERLKSKAKTFAKFFL